MRGREAGKPLYHKVTAILDEPPPVCSGGDTAKGGEVVSRLDALAVRQCSRPEENRQGQAALRAVAVYGACAMIRGYVGSGTIR